MDHKFLQEIREYLSDKNCVLIAVTKTHPPETLQVAYQAGLRIFGENKAQEMASKFQLLPQDISWHMIGHLQSNKVKYIAPFVSLIHSVDSLSLLKEINRQAIKHNRVLECLLQIHIAKEETKFGLNTDEAKEILFLYQKQKFPGVRLKGLMGLASNTSDLSEVRKEFLNLKLLFEEFKTLAQDFSVLSMGMSSDFKIAVEEGSTMIRIGSSLFGQRHYSAEATV